MLLQVRNLRCGYGSLEIVKGVSLHVSAREVVALIGANGAGKTSLLRAIAGLLLPWRGEILIRGRNVVGCPPWKNVSHAMVLVPEGRQLFADLTVKENLLLGGYHNPDRRMVIAEVLERFPRLEERSRQLAGTLSGGEQQMLALGRALVARPQLVLLDEPSLGLAPLMVQEVFAVIRQLRDQGVTVFLIEQNAVAALEIADRAYVMETGEIVLEGEADDLSRNPEVRRAYLGKSYREIWE
jgi:branched-chain amino acid transport system ATP-binding protein